MKVRWENKLKRYEGGKKGRPFKSPARTSAYYPRDVKNLMEVQIFQQKALLQTSRFHVSLDFSLSRLFISASFCFSLILIH